MPGLVRRARCVDPGTRGAGMRGGGRPAGETGTAGAGNTEGLTSGERVSMPAVSPRRPRLRHWTFG